jgi:hypothetical protein
MSNYFDTMFSEAADTTLDAVFAEPFDYGHSGTLVDGSPITATLSTHPIIYDASGSVVETVHTHVFVVTATDISFNGTVRLPQPGDKITHDNGDGTQDVYEVCKGEKTRCYDPIDGQGYRLTVFTQLTGRGVAI